MDKELKKSDTEIDRILDKVYSEQDSARANIVLVVSFIDQRLAELLKAALLPSNNDEDRLFYSYGPLYNLGPKIDLSMRMGLISYELSSALHKLRKIRERAAHDHENISFDNSDISDVINSLFARLNSVYGISSAQGKISTENKFKAITFSVLYQIKLSFEEIKHPHPKSLVHPKS